MKVFVFIYDTIEKYIIDMTCRLFRVLYLEQNESKDGCMCV